MFATPGWMNLWREHLARGESVAVVCKRDGVVFGIWLFDVVNRGRVRLARLAGHGPADELGPVCSPADLGDAAHILRDVVESRQFPADLVLLENLPSDRDWRQWFSQEPLLVAPSPVLDMRDMTHEEWLARGTSKARGRRRRAQETFAKRGSITRIDQLEQVPAAMDDLLALHELRWSDGQSVAFNEPLDLFHREFAMNALKRGWLRLFIARIGEQPIAAWYGFRFGEATWFYQSGRDPGADKLAPGIQLMLASIDRAFEDGSRELRLLRGGEDYKSRFSNSDRKLDTFLIPCSMKGHICAAAVTATGWIPGLRGFVLNRFG